ncbi:MAG: hypothetical protein ABJO27_20825 [Pseudoruegeria sp.]
MTDSAPERQKFNIAVVAQGGRLQYEALLFFASFQAANPDFPGNVYFLEPQHNHRWSRDPKINNHELKAQIEDMGGIIVPFENHHFGEYYPYGNKIEGLKALPKGEPFVFFDTDTLVTGSFDQIPFDFDRPSASMKREGTWPTIELYGPGYGQIWKSLYDKFDLDYQSSLDLSQPDEFWERYLYFNAGWFFYKCPHEFGDRFLHYALQIRDHAPEELVCQEMDPWLDQVALPLTIHSFRGGRHTIPDGLLDGSVTCHYRVLPLAYARENDKVIETLEAVAAPNKIKKHLKNYEAFKRMIFQGRGQKVRAMFDRDNLPIRERAIRNQIKRANFWMR